MISTLSHEELSVHHDASAAYTVTREVATPSTDATPEAIVRARTVADPNADYRSYVRSTTCENGRFSFSGLPDGGWFIIAPVSADGEERVVLMRHVDTRSGRVSVTL